MKDQNDTQVRATEMTEAVRVVKCKPGQGKLNRLIAKAQIKLQELGYPDRRFKRDYAAGTANYICREKGATAHVNIHTKEISGTAFEAPYVAPTTKE